MKLAILSVSLGAIKDALMMPKDYEIAGVSFDTFGHLLNLTIQSDSLPEIEEGQRVPTLTANVCVELLPNVDPAYRKISAEYSVEAGL